MLRQLSRHTAIYLAPIPGMLVSIYRIINQGRTTYIYHGKPMLGPLGPHSGIQLTPTPGILVSIYRIINQRRTINLHHDNLSWDPWRRSSFRCHALSLEFSLALRRSETRKKKTYNTMTNPGWDHYV